MKERQKGRRCLWERVQLFRRKDRPTGSDYIKRLFTDFIELHGDRYYKDDKAIIGGIANFQGIPVSSDCAGKGRTTKRNIEDECLKGY